MIKQTGADATEHMGGEEQLWQSVIVSTIQEWIHGPLRRQREAEQYLFNDEIDFPAVCESAGMNAKSLREKLLKLKASGSIRQNCLLPA